LGEQNIQQACRGRGEEQKDTHHLIAFEQDNATTLVAGGEVVAGGIKLHGRDNVGWMGEE
jgi:hypothetical protein